MEHLINKTIQSSTVNKVIERLHMKKDDIWHLFLDSGIEYLEILACRAKRKKNFDRQFKQMISENPDFAQLDFNSVFVAIRNSPSFWFWWSTQVWRICRNANFHDSTDLFLRLQFHYDFIPHFILKRIFNVKNTQCRPRTDGLCQAETSTPGATEAKAGKSDSEALRYECVSRITISNKQY